jgi:cardiolipin synthase
MTHFVGGNQIELLRNGEEYFPALELAIKEAKHDIHLQVYIYQADVIGHRIAIALKNAANRGINVNVLLDGFGCKYLSRTFVEGLKQAGVQVMFYSPNISPWTLKKRRLRRLHHKIVVIDEQVGFVGGINIIDDYDVPNSEPPRIDYAVRIEGTLLPALYSIAQKLWHRIAWLHFKSMNEVPVKSAMHTEQHLNNHLQHNNGIKAALVLRDNVLHRHDIENAYLEAISHAKSEIIIANAYFVPGRKFRLALLDAANRGVKVKLLLQGRLEYFIMFATHAFYSEFLKNGIEIYEYRKSFMHSKVAVIDRHWATVGSSNIDPFSLLLARETNVFVKDTAFATELQSDIETVIQDGADLIKTEHWAQSNIFKRFSSWIAYGLVRFFLGVIGHSIEK